MSGPASGLGHLLMPKLGLTMEEGKVAKWQVRPGEPFAAGDILVVVETDDLHRWDVLGHRCTRWRRPPLADGLLVARYGTSSPCSSNRAPTSGASVRAKRVVMCTGSQRAI